MKAHLILYVADQAASRDFYSRVLDLAPSLDVPGMTEFELTQGSVLGLMPVAGAERLLGDRLRVAPPSIDGASAELYLVVNDAPSHHARAMVHGARELSSYQMRDWGHHAAYSLDLDGHVLAFAQVP